MNQTSCSLIIKISHSLILLGGTYLLQKHDLFLLKHVLSKCLTTLDKLLENFDMLNVYNFSCTESSFIHKYLITYHLSFITYVFFEHIITIYKHTNIFVFFFINLLNSSYCVNFSKS